MCQKNKEELKKSKGHRNKLEYTPIDRMWEKFRIKIHGGHILELTE